MPIVVKPEDIRLPKKMLKKDILCRLSLEAGLSKSAQEMLIAMIEGKLGYVPEGLEERLSKL